MEKYPIYLSVLLLLGCTSKSLKPIEQMTVQKVDIQEFMGNWYVLAGRFTSFEKDVHNALEVYKWNTKKNRIDIGFTYRQGSFDGKLKSIPQTGWVYNEKSGSHWKVSPFWPLKFDYLIVALAPDSSWTVIGVPNGDYFWIMARDYRHAEGKISDALSELKKIGYPTDPFVIVPHKWP